ncbi:hypothetical protein RND81_10G062900 [Saponaria officinalis]|uniref:Fe2OG dioxygenase domain-containing protein n=1 Tax=Saponaria officinalis TaxID=3572 RepID=A0AAW1I103_SAPOF
MFNFGQVIDHNVPIALINETTSVIKEFFALPVEEKERYCSTDTNKKFIIYTSSVNYDKEALHYGRDAARHLTVPKDECEKDWPQKPLRYRKIIRDYTDAVEKVGLRLLRLLVEGLGLETHYFEKEKLGENPNFTVNHYPKCPKPEETWGSAKHYDPGLMTILLQDDVPGLQALHKGKWIAIETIPYAFVVNVGNLLEIVTNES